MRDFLTLPGSKRLKISARGSAILTNPHLNRGTAFTLEDRKALGLVGLPA